MGVIVSFSYSAWISRYPEFSGVDPATAQEYFLEAGLYLNNSGGGPVTSEQTQSMLLNMLVSHIAKLYAAQFNGLAATTNPGAAPAPSIVGRIASATEGSVTVALEFNEDNPAASWFLQTPYGASFWRATAAYRTFRYVPGTMRRFNTFGPG
jgi:hypothetical protein